MFKLLEWHDSYIFWHLSKIYRRDRSIQVNDIGYWKGVKGHHVFVNSELGQYMDHMKGKRKIKGRSAKSDLRKQRTESYWQNIHKDEFLNKLDHKTQQEIISKVAKGTQGN